ncbi:predicted protein [Streptomyces viridochromogenes DSM 40736]|uniref:Predicted protein n=1 Tax=Streptomyces viridochromogenes (strain DSM 40736 / JCM 4977 / BCRC 1201 / Tue 494) TaxID=591159 RepID=D9XBD3_STRVT|nr:predicted protein [Streptomyces viridochromogenes DSM 40736]
MGLPPLPECTWRARFASPEAFLGIGTTCIVMLYLAYAMVTGPLLVRRLRGQFTVDGTDETGAPLFSLGRWESRSTPSSCCIACS